MAYKPRFIVQTKVGALWVPAHRGTVNRNRAEQIKSSRPAGYTKMKAV
jgi:hypothetical protein